MLLEMYGIDKRRNYQKFHGKRPYTRPVFYLATWFCCFFSVAWNSGICRCRVRSASSDSHLFSFSLTHGYDLKSVVQK